MSVPRETMTGLNLIEQARAVTDAIQMAAERLGCEAAMDSCSTEATRLRAKMKSIAADLFEIMMVPTEAATALEEVLEALKEIGDQKLREEMVWPDIVAADFEAGYEECVRKARTVRQSLLANHKDG